MMSNEQWINCRVNGVKKVYRWKYVNKSISNDIYFKAQNRVYHLREHPGTTMIQALEKGDSSLLEALCVKNTDRIRRKVCPECNYRYTNVSESMCSFCKTDQLKRKRKRHSPTIQIQRKLQHTLVEKQKDIQRLKEEVQRLAQEVKTLKRDNGNLSRKYDNQMKTISERNKDIHALQMKLNAEAQKNSTLFSLLEDRMSLESNRQILVHDILLTVSRMSGTWKAAQGMLLPHQRQLVVRADYPGSLLHPFKRILPAGVYDSRKLSEALQIPESTVNRWKGYP